MRSKAEALALAETRARLMVRRGDLSPEAAAEQFMVEAAVRLKALDRGWSESKINRRIRARMFFCRMWKIGRLIPFRPLGGILVEAGDAIEAAARRVRNERVDAALSEVRHGTTSQ